MAETRTEYRVVIQFDGGHPWTTFGPFDDLMVARRFATEERGECPVVIERRNVTTTPWAAIDSTQPSSPSQEPGYSSSTEEALDRR